MSRRERTPPQHCQYFYIPISSDELVWIRGSICTTTEHADRTELGGEQSSRNDTSVSSFHTFTLVDRGGEKVCEMKRLRYRFECRGRLDPTGNLSCSEYHEGHCSVIVCETSSHKRDRVVHCREGESEKIKDQKSNILAYWTNPFIAIPLTMSRCLNKSLQMVKFDLWSLFLDDVRSDGKDNDIS